MNPLNEESLEVDEATDSAKMQAIYEMSQMMIEYDVDEMHNEDFRLAQAREINLLAMAQKERLKEQMAMPETKIQKMQNQKEKQRAMEVLARQQEKLKEQ